MIEDIFRGGVACNFGFYAILELSQIDRYFKVFDILIVNDVKYLVN